MEHLVTRAHRINDCQPLRFSFLAEAELLSVVTCVGPRTELFDILDSN